MFGFTFPGKNHLLWGVVIALAVIVAIFRFQLGYKLVTGQNPPARS
jgi:hypothetical protein